MAVKKSTKARTGSKKKMTLKWWYVLPVIAVVAIAGYAIVTFSEAATQVRSAGRSLNCPSRIIHEKGSLGRACEVQRRSGPVTSTWSKSDQGSNSRQCATGVREKGSVRVRFVYNGAAPWQGQANFENERQEYGSGTWEICSPSFNNFERGQWLLTSRATIEVYNNGGFVSVIKVWLKQ